MHHHGINAEEIAFALRQAESRVPLQLIAASLSSGIETLLEWRQRYSELFTKRNNNFHFPAVTNSHL